MKLASGSRSLDKRQERRIRHLQHRSSEPSTCPQWPWLRRPIQALSQNSQSGRFNKASRAPEGAEWREKEAQGQHLEDKQRSGPRANKWWNGKETRHTEQKLDATTNTRLERSSNPGVCEAGVLTNKDHLTEEEKSVLELLPMTKLQVSVATYVVVSLEVLGKVQLVLTHSRGGPTAALEGVEEPADAAVLARVLLPSDLAMNLDHGVLDVGDVLLLWDTSPALAQVRTRDVRSEDGTLASAVDVVRGVADGANARDVGARRAGADDGVVEVFPEARLVLECDLAGRHVGQPRDGVADGGAQTGVCEPPSLHD